MAEFVQMMKDWRRMCVYYTEKSGDNSCDVCPLGGCNAIYEEDGSTDYANVEEKVAAWAAEHPEPVYPTWMEYLESIKVIVPRKNYTVMDTYSLIIGQIKTTRISADIAQKLGIEPVPVVHGDCGATNATDARKKLGL